MSTNPVHQDPADGKWYHWIETWADRNGPFETEEECETACNNYALQLNQSPEALS